MQYHPLMFPVALRMDFHMVWHARVGVFFSIFAACKMDANQERKCLVMGLGQQLLRLVAAFPLTSGGLEPSHKY